jgi:hypothetical protein
MKFKKYIWTIILVVIAVGLTSLLNSGLSYIDKLESQITERDSLISRLTISEALVKEYFDIEQDSLTNELTYTLKPSKQEPVQIVYRNMSETFKAGDDILTSEEVVKRYNSLIGEFSQYADENEKLVDKYNQLIRDHNKLVKDYNELVNLYNKKSGNKAYSDALKAALDLINKNYGINYEITNDSTSYKVVVPSSQKIDSALMLLPYFRENLHYDEKSGKWVITRRVVEKK